jgi:hypothetical protein
MEQIISSPTSRVASLTPGDRKPQERGSELPLRKAKSATAGVRAASRSNADDLAELAAPETQEKHQLDELA